MTRPRPALGPSGRPSPRGGLIATALFALAQVAGPASASAAGPASAAARAVSGPGPSVPAQNPAAPTSQPVVGPPAATQTELSPGVQYEDAMAHAGDRIAFAPGGRVTVGFRPRVGDAWQVGGRAPRALPAGSATGRELVGAPATPPMAAPPNATATSATATIDGPVVDPSTLPLADDASASQPVAGDPLSLDGTRLRRQVFGFLPYWEVNSAVLDYETLSTIAYFSVGADRNGNLLRTNTDGSTSTGWSGWTSSRLTSIINAAHAKGTRVVLTLSVFAWTTGQAATQGALLGSPTARLNLARQAAAAVRARGADGINLDFEPIASGHADDFTAFVRTVRAELNRQAAGYQLTFDTTGFIGNYPVEAATAAGAADAIFIMGYDYRGSGAGNAGSIDPLAGPAYDLQDTINAYTARVAPSKLILGLPWYGRAWSTTSNVVNGANQSGTKFGTSNTVIYDTAAAYAAQFGRRWDSRELTPWVAYQRQNCTTTYGCVTSWRQIYYDDAVSLKLRYDMINRRGLRGAGIWALGYDGARPEMRQAIGEKFLDDRTAPLAGILTMPSTQATEAFPVSWIGTDESGIRDYDVQVSIHGGPWVDWLVKTTATSATYQGANGYGFAFRVRARDTHGNASPWDVSSVYTSHVTMGPGTFAKVVASSVNIRAAASTSAALVTTAPAGTILAITGGPTNADGFTWWKVSLPIGEWGPVGQVTTDVWVASGDGTNTYVTSIGAPNTTTVGMPGGTVPTPGARFVGIDPLRVLDTRLGTGLWGSFASGAARTFGVAGHGPIPSDAVAVTGTLTVVGQTSAGWASLGPSAATVGSTSVVNAPQGDARGVGVTVMLGPAGTLAAEWSGTGGSRAQMVFDVSGYFEPGTSGATYVPLAPARVLDTRTGNGLAGLFASNLPRSFHVAGHGGVPAGATAVTGNLTAVGPTSGGYLFVGPAATATPTSSNLNVLKGDTRAASVTVKLSAGGDLAAVWKGSPGARTHVLFDVTGYFVAGGGGATYYPLDAVRVLDTRVPNGLAGVFPRNVTRIFQATGRGTIPVDALAVTGSATVVLPTGAGWLNLGPAGTQLGGTSTLNLPRGDTRANGFTVRTGPGGGLAGMYQGVSGAAANVIVDLTGYFR